MRRPLRAFTVQSGRARRRAVYGLLVGATALTLAFVLAAGEVAEHETALGPEADELVASAEDVSVTPDEEAPDASRVVDTPSGKLSVPDTTFELPLDAPLGLPAELKPAEWASDAQVELGRRLFFDPILSRDRSIACASCHDPAHGFADARPRSLGVEGRETLHNAPTLYNRALGTRFMWDGRAATLEEQVLLPIQDEREMDLALDEAVERLKADGDYRARFQAAFAGDPDADRLARALAAFVRRLLYGASRVDRFRAGEVEALTIEERSGLWLFESRGRCWRCHSGPNFSDEEFHATGIGDTLDPADEGRFAITRGEADRGRFKTPTLRGLAETAPYMHDGSLATLEEVVEHYRAGGRAHPNLDPALAPIEMTAADARNLVAFLRALSRDP